MEYDCILFSGDMNKYENSDSKSSQAILELLNGIENKETVFWVDGNTGPFAIETVVGSCTGKLTDIGEAIERAGAKVLLFPVEITKGGDSIWFVPELCQSDIQMNYLAVTEQYVALNQQLFDYIMEADVRDYGLEYQVPVGFISGSDDWTTPVKYSEDYYNSVSAPMKDVALINGCGHSPHYDAPAEFCDALEEMLSEILE